MLETRSVNADGYTTRSLTDGAGRTLQTIDQLGKISTLTYDAIYDELGISAFAFTRSDAPNRMWQYHRLARWIVMFLATYGYLEFLFLVFWFGFASSKSKPKNK